MQKTQIYCQIFKQQGRDLVPAKWNIYISSAESNSDGNVTLESLSPWGQTHQGTTCPHQPLDGAPQPCAWSKNRCHVPTGIPGVGSNSQDVRSTWTPDLMKTFRQLDFSLKLTKIAMFLFFSAN